MLKSLSKLHWLHHTWCFIRRKALNASWWGCSYLYLPPLMTPPSLPFPIPRFHYLRFLLTPHSRASTLFHSALSFQGLFFSWFYSIKHGTLICRLWRRTLNCPLFTCVSNHTLLSDMFRICQRESLYITCRKSFKWFIKDLFNRISQC